MPKPIGERLQTKLFPFAVRDFVRQGRHPHVGRLFERAEDERWVQWALKKTSLLPFAARRVTEISGGEFQRAVLARTLAQRPRLVLLDEPTANLDIGYQIEMLHLQRELAATEDFAAVIVTHELNLAANLPTTWCCSRPESASAREPPARFWIQTY